MSAEQAEPAGDESFRFEDLTPVALVEIDRYCEACGYNLRTRALLPPSWRAPLAHLWLVDGKTPPGTVDAASR